MLSSCPGCGYDFSGLAGARCPECGLALTPALVRRLEPSRRMFRSAQAGVLIAFLLAVSHLALWGPRLWRREDQGAFAAAVLMVLGSSMAMALWLCWRGRCVALPRHVQGRIATLAWVLATAVLLVVLGVP
jgi:hypothetical protein